MLKRTTLVLLCSVAFGAAANANTFSDTLYYTTFSGGTDVSKVTATYNGSTFTLGTATGVAATPGADGLVLNPNNGDLLVGGQRNAIYQVNPSSGTFTTAVPGMTVYELTVDPTGNYVWAGGAENSTPGISKTPINPFGGAGTTMALTGAVTDITHITFAPNLPTGTAFFTSNPDNSGTPAVFGKVNLSTGATTSIFTSSTAGDFHGMEYDPFSGDLILAGGNHLLQVDPVSDAIVSSLTLPNDSSFDQGAVDGKGDIFWADNNGDLLVLDYSATDKIGTGTVLYDQFFAGSLDDIAPLIGEGGTGKNPVPEPFTLSLFGAGFAGMIAVRRRKKANA